MASIKYKNNQSLFLIFKILLYGVFSSELYLINKLFQTHFFNISLTKEHSSILFIMEFLILIIPSTYIIFILFKYLDKIMIIIKSWRIDLFIIFILGISINLIFNGMYIEFLKKRIVKLNQFQMLLIYVTPLIIIISSVIKKIQFKFTSNESSTSSFFSDQAIKNKEEDRFDFSQKAERFAKQVYNNNSSESLVFGLDAPWGTGKSSFLNLCEECWDKNYNKVIVYKFNPLKYEKQENLLEKFVEGLTITIKNHFFIPEIESLTSKYTKLLKNSNMSFGFTNINFKFPFGNNSMKNIFEQLEYSLLNIDKKIIIIIDDLDRLDFISVKEVLYTIKKSFSLPNISYILCYDTENITSFKNTDCNVEKITEFLEKFINLKMCLYIDNELLLEYFTKLKDQEKNKHLFVDTELLSKAVEGLNDIFKSKDFHYYYSFIGDARKMKRLLNLILLLKIEKTDFPNCDFNKLDLINLLLIYINFPNIFRKIYLTETKGKSGFFSCVSKYDDGFPANINKDTRYSNSTYYIEYLEQLTPSQKFIVNEIFDVSKKINDSYGNISKEILTSSACFNKTNRNLEDYLDLIIKTKYPIETNQYQLYSNLKDEILNGTNIEEVFSKKYFSCSMHENNHSLLWEVLINADKKNISAEKAKEIILYAIKALPQHSLIFIDNITIEFRQKLIFFIVKLLDEIGWSDDEGKQSYNNSIKNIIKISYWIFGENEYKDDGILNLLSQRSENIIGLYDLLLFRLRCSANRGGGAFNLTHSLSIHGDPNAPTTGNVDKIVIDEMRKISQKVFEIFDSQYIKNKVNIFDKIDELKLKDVTGKYFENLDFDLNDKLEILKSAMKSFITYQLGNRIISSGIGCGYYDISGKEDKNEINVFFNKYLFETCFIPKENNGYEHFLNYLLLSLPIDFDDFGGENRLNIESFTKVLDKNLLATYWKTHKTKIESKKYNEKSFKVLTANGALEYKNYLINIFKTLDTLLEKN